MAKSVLVIATLGVAIIGAVGCDSDEKTQGKIKQGRLRLGREDTGQDQATSAR